MSMGNDPRPYEVWHYPDRARQTAKGLYGRYKTPDEAQTAAVACMEQFNGWFGNGAVKTKIKINEAEIARRDAQITAERDDDDTTLESSVEETGIDACAMLIETLMENHKIEDAIARRMVRTHASIAAKGLGNGVTLKSLRETAKAIINAQDNNPKETSELAKARARIEELERERDEWLESTSPGESTTSKQAALKP